MFHEMDINKPQSIFKYLPLLSFTESYIYQVRNWNCSSGFFLYRAARGFFPRIFFLNNCNFFFM
jgi:hypothetical protein